MCGEADTPEKNPDRPRPFAVVDETVPFVGGGVCYAVVSAVISSDEERARSMMRTVVPTGRRRPFHWHREGVVAKSAMVAALDQLGVSARAVVVPCGRHQQETARAIAFATTIHHLVDDGCGAVLVEARNPAQDGRDRATFLDVVRPRKATLAVSWERKPNELLWIADAIGGVVHEHLTRRDQESWFDRFLEATGLILEYRAATDRRPPKKR